ncbi:hypothetical protein KSP39_PZI020200 [Platanthera zijinensis]|uniref:Uncharacterized protein n=1 Tax=Platanthera zijinensis TaxID=2320716 RepID=A0AAP0FX73_9ASPA
MGARESIRRGRKARADSAAAVVLLCSSPSLPFTVSFALFSQAALPQTSALTFTFSFAVSASTSVQRFCRPPADFSAASPPLPLPDFAPARREVQIIRPPPRFSRRDLRQDPILANTFQTSAPLLLIGVVVVCLKLGNPRYLLLMLVHFETPTGYAIFMVADDGKPRYDPSLMSLLSHVMKNNFYDSLSSNKSLQTAGSDRGIEDREPTKFTNGIALSETLSLWPGTNTHSSHNELFVQCKHNLEDLRTQFALLPELHFVDC